MSGTRTATIGEIGEVSDFLFPLNLPYVCVRGCALCYLEEVAVFPGLFK